MRSTRARLRSVLIGLLCLCSAPVRAVLGHNFWGGDQIGPQTSCSTPMPLSAWLLFFGGVTLVIAAIISTALVDARGGGSR